MSIAADDKQNLYLEYAEYCLKLVKTAEPRQSRVVLRQMAADWLHLADRQPAR
jgi:hypothetical protein